ncbi:MAG: hypothetical protein ACRELX_11565 [Longimicrobiales bacterium]
MIVDTLRPPPLLDVTAHAYKDWLHVNVFDHDSGCIGIFNASLHGSPRDARARAIGTALVHSPAAGWVGNVEVAAIAQANIGSTSIGLEHVAVATDGPGAVLASAVLPFAGLEAGFTASARSRPIDIEHPLPFGAGWISWYVLPRLAVTGGMVVDSQRLDLSGATAYHDHNWGRWHWGDDIGWEWGACAARDPETTFVVSRATDRAHSTSTGALLIAELAGERRSFPDANVRIRLDGRFGGRLLRLPGALAALHQDRIAPALPDRILVRADDGIDGVEIEIRVRAAAQLIAADPVRRGYGFLHEMVGTFTASHRIGGRMGGAHGLAVFEYVD